MLGKQSTTVIMMEHNYLLKIMFLRNMSKGKRSINMANINTVCQPFVHTYISKNAEYLKLIVVIWGQRSSCYHFCF